MGKYETTADGSAILTYLGYVYQNDHFRNEVASSASGQGGIRAAKFHI